MKQLNIIQKLEAIDVSIESLSLGDFDFIGELTAKRNRTPNDPNYRKYGAFYRASYERGILIYHLIRKYDVRSFLEIGFGRGYATLCAAKAFADAGVQGSIVTIDPALEEEYVRNLAKFFPQEWFKCIKFVKNTSLGALTANTESYDFAYIDGDHSYVATKADWGLVQDHVNKLVLFDDYHLPSKIDPGIDCRRAIDEIDWRANSFEEPELIIMDRIIFPDDRGYTIEQKDYGQVLLTKSSVACVRSNDW